MRYKIKVLICIHLVVIFPFLNLPFVFVPSVSAGHDWLSGWDKRVKIEIDSGDIDEDLYSFPILIHLSNSTIGSGMYDEDASFVFDEVGSNSKKIALTVGETEETYVEIERWDASSEEAWLWANVSASSSSDTNLYLYYDNDHADNTAYVDDTNPTGVSANVWDEDFMLVHHLVGASIDALDDSTSNDNNVTSEGGSPSPAYNYDAKIAKGVDLEDTFKNCLQIPDDSTLDGFTVGATWEVWVDPDETNLDVGEWKVILCKYETAGNERSWMIAFYYESGKSQCIQINLSSDGSNWDYAQYEWDWVADNWYHIVWVWTPNEYVKVYVNGTQQTLARKGPRYSQINSGSAPLDFGRSTYSLSGRCFDGTLDEVRVSDTNRTAAWVKASYESGRDHLLDFGTEETGGGSRGVSQKYGFGVCAQYYRTEEAEAYSSDLWTLVKHIGASYVNGAPRRWAADQAAEHGLKVSFRYTTPPWNPDTMEDYFRSKDAMKAHLDQYNIAQYRNHPGVWYHILCGEPCGGYDFDPRNPPQNVLDLIEVIRYGINYIREQDPTHPVTVALNSAGAHGEGSGDYIEKRKAWIARFIDVCDVLDYHYYPLRHAGSEWWRNPQAAQERWIKMFDEVIIPSSQGKPIIIGETGCPSGPFKDYLGNMAQFTEQNQADFFRLYGEVTRQRGIIVTVYKLIDASVYEQQNENWGLFNPENDGTMNIPKVAASRVKDYLSV